ncbi:hypothetical protein GCM10027188_29790 [Lysobacter humi (ex Lee et al. 2017)]
MQPLVFLVRLLPDYFAASGPLYGIGFVLVAVVAVAAAMVLLFGIPIFLMLRRLNRLSWVWLGVAGVLLGGLPAALSWPRPLEGYSAGHNWHGKYVETYVNGTPTLYAWLGYWEGVAYFSLHGLVGALVFYAVWRRGVRPNNSSKPTPLRGAA